jgi:hypothetical protein
MRPLTAAVAILAVVLALSAAPSTFAEEGSAILEGFVVGDVDGKVSALQGAEVRADAGGSSSYTTYTDSKGYFSIPCDAGSYTVTVKCPGYQTAVLAGVSAPDVLEFSLEPRVSDVAWGLDTPHAMEVTAILVLMAILAGGLITYALSKEKGSKIQMVNDLEEDDGNLEDGEEEEVDEA